MFKHTEHDACHTKHDLLSWRLLQQQGRMQASMYMCEGMKELFTSSQGTCKSFNKELF